MRDQGATPLAPDAKVAAYEQRQAGISWPLPVDAKLEELLRRAHEAGERTSRRELVAAIVALAEHSGEQLGQMLRDYRRSRVLDILESPAKGSVVAFTQHGPGPRKRSA